MCYFALVGARTEAQRLREVLAGAGVDVDTDVAPDSGSLAYFAETDAVVCLTINGCSCDLLTDAGKAAAIGGMHHARAAPALRQALAAAAVHFKTVRLLTRRGSRTLATSALPTRRTTTLSQFLQSDQPLVNHLICIIA
jgi:hypothetical protein